MWTSCQGADAGRGDTSFEDMIHLVSRTPDLNLHTRRSYQEAPRITQFRSRNIH